MPKIKHATPEVYTAKTKEFLHSLESEYQWLDFLKGHNKAYEPLLNIVQQQGRKGEEDVTPSPTIAQIAKELNESSAKVSKWLSQIYSDLYELNDERPELFKVPGKRYELRFKNTYTSQYGHFTLWLDQTLTYKNKFEWHFINAKLGEYNYYVHEIDHSHRKGELITTIYLKSGFYNSYRETLLNKAEFMHLLDFDERFHLNDYQLDHILRERVENGRFVSIETKKGRSYFKENN
jgi:hypothetical protein